ncbi:hypothetical protein VTI74DRAFT_412 [Chaetomium olivicolor]
MSQQAPQTSRPTFINLPQPPSNPDTPSEIPGTPTSTTTSLSALSTTAIKDGHRGALHHRGHQHSPSTNSLEAERADRISRLAGLSTVSTLRSPPTGVAQHNANPAQSGPTSAGFGNIAAAAPMGGLTPAFFDAAGQPVAATKVSTVGSASATESVGGQTTTTEVGGERDEDMLTEMDSASTSGYIPADTIDEELDNLTSQSVGGFEDHMSDDGNASLVAFGEGAGSTVSGPIYHRRPLPNQGGATGPGAGATWGLERSSSGLSEGGTSSNTQPGVGGGFGRRDFAARPLERDTGSDTPVSQSAIRERREALMVDGIAMDNAAPSTAAAAAAVPADEDIFVDTSTRGPVPVQRTAISSSIRETQQPHSHQQQLHQQSSRETAERIVRERLDEGEGQVGPRALGSPKGGERLGRFYFEER